MNINIYHSIIILINMHIAVYYIYDYINTTKNKLLQENPYNRQTKENYVINLFLAFWSIELYPSFIQRLYRSRILLCMLPWS